MSEGTTTTPPPTPTPAAAPQAHGHRPGGAVATAFPATLVPDSGWHFLHVFYRVDRAILAGLPDAAKEQGRRQVVEALTRGEGSGIEQLQAFAVPGHKADFGFMGAGCDLLALHGVETAIASSAIGPALTATYSFYSITEVSEYVPDAGQYGEILKREGVDPESPTFKTKVASYEQRLGPMNKQRLYPEFPDWPCLCFYPMSKMRQADQNWYLLPFETRAELMSQHGKSGMRFAGKVTQVITASTGLDDWEWGVTLWAKNPSYLKDIVYTMRFDESSAKYALFGPFYFGYILGPDALLAALRI
jgi:chlorite dismutase